MQQKRGNSCTVCSQASQEVSKAASLDYVATPEERTQHALERPLDRYLMPLATSLALRTSLTQVGTYIQADIVH